MVQIFLTSLPEGEFANRTTSLQCSTGLCESDASTAALSWRRIQRHCLRMARRSEFSNLHQSACTDVHMVVLSNDAAKQRLWLQHLAVLPVMLCLKLLLAHYYGLPSAC